MDILQAIHQRRAVREFTDEPVAQSAIDRLIELAVHAPSAVNAQPWLFTVVRNADLLDRISEKSKAHMLAAVESGDASAHFREHLINPDFHIFYHAPVLILISAEKSDAWAREDAALAAENLMLAACAEGLGTCWIGFAQRWLETEEGRCTIDVPSTYQPVAPIILGHPKSAIADVPRKPPTIHWIG
jgi:nitroreductase